MDFNDLDEDELAYLAQWIAVTSPQTTIDLRIAPAWRFAQARLAAYTRDLSEFPDIGE